MSIPRFGQRLLLMVPIGLCGCIGTAQVGPTDATHSDNGQKARAKTDVPCENPAAPAGDSSTKSTTPCGERDIGTEQRTAEPPEIHPY